MMKAKFLRKGEKNPKNLILQEIKKSQGLSVSELSDRIGLSYMGVKQHCVGMEEEGLLDRWRRPKGMGRPEIAYRLTSDAQDFFPTEYDAFTFEILDSVQQVYGPTAADKILFNIFKNRGNRFASKLSASTLPERARELAALRSEEGYMCESVVDEKTGECLLVDYNSPILICMEKFVIMRELERQMLERVLGVKVQRKEERISGLYKCTFRLGEPLGASTNLFVKR